MEVWNVALSIGYIIARILKILLVSLFFIARFDEQLLAPGVVLVAGIELDGFWLCFRKDLLMHEAHRHPYIERLGLLCLLKLKHREHFGAHPNACWRLLYVLVAMPWMKKYLVCPYPSSTSSNKDFSIAESSEKMNDDEADICHDVSTSNFVVKECEKANVEYSEESPNVGAQTCFDEENAEEMFGNPDSVDVAEACSGHCTVAHKNTPHDLSKKQ
jgi:hypothetical protein